MILAGFAALTANPMRTVLSTLGVIIGVGALVTILALSDGLERFSIKVSWRIERPKPDRKKHLSVS